MTWLVLSLTFLAVDPADSQPVRSVTDVHHVMKIIGRTSRLGAGSSRFDRAFGSREFDLTDEQRARISSAYDAYQRLLNQIYNGVPKTKEEAEARKKAAFDLIDPLNRAFAEILRPEQIRRIREIHFQEILFGSSPNLITVKLRGEDFGVDLTDEQRAKLGLLLTTYIQEREIERVRQRAKQTAKILQKYLSREQLDRVRECLGEKPAQFPVLTAGYEELVNDDSLAKPMVSESQVELRLDLPGMRQAFECLSEPALELKISPEQAKQVQEIKKFFDDKMRAYSLTLFERPAPGEPVARVDAPDAVISQTVYQISNVLSNEQFSRLKQLSCLYELTNFGADAFARSYRRRTDKFGLDLSGLQLGQLQEAAAAAKKEAKRVVVPVLAARHRDILHEILTEDQWGQLRQGIGDRTENDELLRIGFDAFFESR